MKKLLLISLLSFSSITSMHVNAKTNAEALDKIVAIINDDVVTKSELTHGIATAKAQIAQEHLPLPADKILEKQVLDQLINKKLQLQTARLANLKTTDDDVNKAVTTVAQQNNMTVNELYKRVAQEGMTTTEYRNEMRDQITLQKLQQQEVAGKVNITPTEIAAFLRSKSWRAQTEREYRLEDILIPLNDTPTTNDIAAAKKRADMVLTMLRKGQDFQTIVKANPADKNTLQDGDLGWRKITEIPTVFASQVTSMKKNSVAGPIQAANGFHLIRLTDSRPLASQPAAAAPSQKTIEAMLLQKKFEEAVQVWVSKLRTQAFIVTNPNQE